MNGEVLVLLPHLHAAYSAIAFDLVTHVRIGQRFAGPETVAVARDSSATCRALARHPPHHADAQQGRVEIRARAAPSGSPERRRPPMKRGPVRRMGALSPGPPRDPSQPVGLAPRSLPPLLCDAISEPA